MVIIKFANLKQSIASKKEAVFIPPLCYLVPHATAMRV